MRVEKMFYTFMNQRVEDEEEAEIAERQEYEDVALAVKKACENTDCEMCPFDDSGCCIFRRAPHSWDLDFNDFHDYDMQVKAKCRKWSDK